MFKFPISSGVSIGRKRSKIRYLVKGPKLNSISGSAFPVNLPGYFGSVLFVAIKGLPPIAIIKLETNIIWIISYFTISLNIYATTSLWPGFIEYNADRYSGRVECSTVRALYKYYRN